MTIQVCLGANTNGLLKAGGHMWFFLNWALGLRALGCNVIWLEEIDVEASDVDLESIARALRVRLEPFGLAKSLAFCSSSAAPLNNLPNGVLSVEAATQSDLLLNLGGKIGPSVVSRFRKSALVDIDPGIMQIWISESKLPLTRHDTYFTTGETVGTRAARFPSCAVEWLYTPPVVYLPAWPVSTANEGSSYTTVSSWWGWWETFGKETFNNEKRTSFLHFLDLPSRTPVQLELALALWGHSSSDEVGLLRNHGWSVCEAFDIGPTPELYRQYVAESRGEFSCAKPSCMKLQNAWMSDRSLCYLAMGKPAIVQHTGASRFLPDADGLFRFRTLDNAVAALAEAEKNYDYHSRQARALVEAHFDATHVLPKVLDRALA